MVNVSLGKLHTQLYDEANGHLYRGHVKIFNASHHIQLIRVQEGDDVAPFPDAPQEVHDAFRDMQSINEGAYDRATVPGLEGQFVVLIYPFAV